MKKYLYLLSFLLTVYFSNAQNIDKEQESELKNELKELMKNPEKYLILKSESNEKTKVISQQTEDIAKLKKENVVLQTNYQMLKDSVGTHQIENTTVANTKNKIESTGETTESTKNYPYSIQIGALKNYDISKDLLNPKVIYYVNVSGTHKYYVGNFATKSEADSFAEKLKKLGIKGAFPVERNYDGDYSTIAKNATYYPNNTTSKAYTTNTNGNIYRNGKKVNFSVDEIRSMTNTTSVESVTSSNQSYSTSDTTTKTDSAQEDSVIYMDTE